MIALLIGVAVFASVTALVLLYWRALALTFPEKLSTEEVYKLTTQDLWKIRVCRYRKGRTNGQPVLLVHGANVNQHTFTSPKGGNLVEYLVERGFDCWTVDLRGCRSSEAPFERHRNQITTDDLLNYDIPAAIRLVQQETGYAKIHYCGQSLGGMLLYAYVLKFGGDSIASGVTLGSPIGFDGVRVGRSPWMARLIKINPAFAGEVSRGLIPFALLFRSSPLAFPMNLRNIARGLNTGHFYNMLEDPLPGVLRDLITWIRTPGWRMDQGQIDVQEGLKTLDIPLFSIFAPLDPFVPVDKAQAFFDALPAEDKRILIASRALGCKRDYNHCDLAFGLEGPREIFGPIARWFESHSSREQMVQIAPPVSTGYQAPLRASERASILSGDSYARRATPVSAEPVAELLIEKPLTEQRPEVQSTPLPSVDLEVLEPLTTTEVVEVEFESLPEPVTAKASKKKVAPVKLAKPLLDAPLADSPSTDSPDEPAPVNLESLEPMITVDPELPVDSAVEAFEMPAVKKRVAGKKLAAKKPAATKKPVAKKSAAGAPAVKKPAAKKPTTSKAKATKVEAPTKAAAKKPAAKTSSKGLDLASASAALTALRPNAPKASVEKSAPIRVKKSGGAKAPGNNEAVETPKSVLKALSNASDAMAAFKQKDAKPKK